MGREGGADSSGKAIDCSDADAKDLIATVFSRGGSGDRGMERVRGVLMVTAKGSCH